MKERSMEKFVVFPFSLGCVGVAKTSRSQPTKNTKSSILHQAVLTKIQVGEDTPSKVKINGFWRFLGRRRFSEGVHTLIKRSFKGFSQLFVYKKEIEEVEMEMEIGYPTDVKHVTHVGWDGSTKTLELLSLPSISIKQYELAMAVQAGGSSRF